MRLSMFPLVLLAVLLLGSVPAFADTITLYDQFNGSASSTFLLTREDIDYPLILQEIRAELRIIQLAERSDATPALQRFLLAQAASLKVESYHAAYGRGGRVLAARSGRSHRSG